MKLITTTLALLAAIILMPVAARASITINSNNIGAMAKLPLGGAGYQFYSGTGIPTPTPISLDASHSSGQYLAESHNTIEFAENSGQTTLLITIDHHEVEYGRAGIAAGFLGGWGEGTSALQFTTDADTPYELSGIYGGSDTIYLTAWLVDVTDSAHPATLFYNMQRLQGGLPITELTLGGTVGDYIPAELQGSLTGQLLAGHTYEWSFAAVLGIDSGRYGMVGEATGNIKLVLGEVTDPGTPGVVPEAASMLTWCGLALTAYWGKTARRRRAA
jgi:hypothetical protein